MMAISESTITNWRTHGVIATAGKNGSEKRIRPYVPIFSRTPASITEPAVGASTWASGSQVWNGNIGTLIANARKKARKAKTWRLPAKPLVAPNARRVTKSKAPTQEPVALWKLNAVARMATSIRSDPTSVYRTNLIVA